jgi:hypothetical protein
MACLGVISLCRQSASRRNVLLHRGLRLLEGNWIHLARFLHSWYEDEIYVQKA